MPLILARRPTSTVVRQGQYRPPVGSIRENASRRLGGERPPGVPVCRQLVAGRPDDGVPYFERGRPHCPGKRKARLEIESQTIGWLVGGSVFAPFLARRAV